MYPELQLNIGLWQKKTDKERKNDLAAALLDFQRKPNIYWLTLEELTKLLDETRIDKPIYLAEFEALNENINWAAFGETPCLAWITPEHEGFYETTRIIASKKYEEGGKVRILSVATFLPVSLKQCLRIAEFFMDLPQNTLVDPEEIRNRPLEFNLPEGRSFPELVKILTGKSIQELFTEKIKAQTDAGEIINQNSVTIRNSSTKLEQIFVGANIEQQALARGYQLDRFRDCPGITNTEALGILGVLNKIFLLPNVNVEADKYNYNKFDICRMCKKLKMVCPPPEGCNVCHDCTIADNLKKAA